MRMFDIVGYTDGTGRALCRDHAAVIYGHQLIEAVDHGAAVWGEGDHGFITPILRTDAADTCCDVAHGTKQRRADGGRFTAGHYPAFVRLAAL